jgi:phosphomevalonate kinase
MPDAMRIEKKLARLGLELPQPPVPVGNYLPAARAGNTSTTIVTFLMVFLIQNTQNRDTEALQLKIDELIRVTEQARNRLINLEDLTEEEMDKVKRELTDIGRADRDNPDTPP